MPATPVVRRHFPVPPLTGWSDGAHHGNPEYQLVGNHDHHTL